MGDCSELDLVRKEVKKIRNKRKCMCGLSVDFISLDKKENKTDAPQERRVQEKLGATHALRYGSESKMFTRGV